LQILFWIIIIALFLLSFVGLIFPIIPSVVVIWGGFLVYHFLINAVELSIWFWLTMGLLTIMIVVADLVANSYFVKKYGGSKWGERIAAVGTIVGSFFYPPFGIILVPLAAVFVTEYVQHRDVAKAAKIGYASFIGFLSSTFAKAIILTLMILFFLVDVFIF